MIYKEVEELVNSEEGLLKLLENYNHCFEKLESYAKYLQTDKLTSDNVQKILLRSTGYYDVLNAVYLGIDTFKENKEGILFSKAKMDFENKEGAGKFNASAVKEEISAQVAIERKVRNWFQAYKEMADRNILASQSWLRYYNETFKRAGVQEG